MSNKPIIGITTNALFKPVGNTDGKWITYNNVEYEKAILRVGGIPLLLPVTSDLEVIKAQLDLCQGILLAGGDDLNPLTYSEEPTKLLGETNMATDRCHLAIAHYALITQKPLLGICRGMQVLNVACGGNVYQDLSEYPRERFKHTQTAPRFECCHSISTLEGSLLNQLLGATLQVNSFHHQAIHRLGTKVTDTAWSKDRIIEGIELDDYPFGVGVQWHPEIMLASDNKMLTLFETFISACI